MRCWGTDQEMFETLVSTYEEHKAASEDPVFMFSVTIQNHGGYDYYQEGFRPTVHLEGYSRDYPEVEEYLSCIQASDRALQWLINYFEGIDRDVAILVYGDHLPRLTDGFFEELHGGPFETKEEQVLQYTVPFFIWTNYETGESEVKLTSMNYLAGLLFEKAGIDLPAYQQYLLDLQTTIPACNALGYYSYSENRFIDIREAPENEQFALNEYNKVIWNGIFDGSNRSEVFFPVGK